MREQAVVRDGAGKPRRVAARTVASWEARMERHEADALVNGVLRLFRVHLGVETVFVSEVAAGRRTIQYLDSDDPALFAVGDSVPAEESYCHHVIAGNMPQFLADPASDPVARHLAVTADLPVGTHLSVPLVFSDGSVYGTLCGFSRRVLPHLEERDLRVVQMLSDMIVGHVEGMEVARREQVARRGQLLNLGRDGLTTVLQPIWDLRSHATVGYEALSRFPILGRGPAEVFADACDLGIGIEVELDAVARSLEIMSRLPACAYLAINVGPATLADPRLAELVALLRPEQTVLEITEHERIEDYPGLLSSLRGLSAMGVRLAIDDVGTGFAGFERILRLEPDILKLDRVLVRDVDSSPEKQAMVAGLLAFAEQVGITVVAEGVETAGERTALANLGVHHAQGYLLARPQAVDKVLVAAA
jgi:EAL domain-containing protein (putative c-di-GMP-specific phosphodiesterase class I)